MKYLTLLWVLSIGFLNAQENTGLLSEAEQLNLARSKDFPRVAQREDVAKFDPVLLRSAAGKGDAQAQFYLGKIAYFNRKYKVAIGWYEKSAIQKHAPSMINLAAICEHGLGNDGKPDYKLAKSLYHSASTLGHPSAWYNLACMYRDGKGGAKDDMKAFTLYSVASALGHADATSELGIIYELGRGVKVNHNMAASFYQKAIENGSVIAISNLGACYVQGLGVAKDELKAVAHFRESVEKNCPHGTRMLGLCYEQGVGVESNIAKAILYYEKAASLNDERAKENLKRLKQAGNN